MVLLDDKTYKETKSFLLNKKKKSPFLLELCDLFKKKYSIDVINIEFNKLDAPGDNRFRLYLIIGNTADYDKMHSSRFCPNKNLQTTIAKDFKNSGDSILNY